MSFFLKDNRQQNYSTSFLVLAKFRNAAFLSVLSSWRYDVGWLGNVSHSSMKLWVGTASKGECVLPSSGRQLLLLDHTVAEVAVRYEKPSISNAARILQKSKGSLTATSSFLTKSIFWTVFSTLPQEQTGRVWLLPAWTNSCVHQFCWYRSRLAASSATLLTHGCASSSWLSLELWTFFVMLCFVFLLLFCKFD